MFFYLMFFSHHHISNIVIYKVIQCFCEQKNNLSGEILLLLPLPPSPYPTPTSVSIQTKAPTQKRCHTLSDHQCDRVFIIFLDHINLNKRPQNPPTLPASPSSSTSSSWSLLVFWVSELAVLSFSAAGKVGVPVNSSLGSRSRSPVPTSRRQPSLAALMCV